jgi:arylsulfatase A-like enzyme
MKTDGYLPKTTAFATMALAAGTTAFSADKPAASASRPNIVWIFSDDHAYQAIGAYGGRLAKLDPTPNIDRIAGGGVVFEKCYVANSICAPSRATLLTGKYSHLNGKATNSGGFDQSQQTFPKLLQRAGYQTAIIGKIHLSGKLQGFDYWEVLPGQGRYNNPVFITGNGTKRYEGYVSEIITEKALDWLKNKRDKSKPFMLMVHHKAPHRNWIPAQKHMSKYADVEIPEPDTLFDDYKTRTTAAHKQAMTVAKVMSLRSDLKVTGNTTGQYAARNKYYKENKPTGEALVRWKYQIYMKDYLRCVWSVDQSVGEILDYLKKNGLDKNTVVFYSSDQGFYLGEHGWFDKRFMYKESFRTPLIVRWPGVVKPNSKNYDLVQNIDFAETFLDIAGAPIPEDMQGRSIVPLLKGETPPNWRKSLYYHYYEFPGCHSVRRHEGVATKRYKLIRFYGPQVPNGEEWEFYDLQADPRELNNIYSNPEMSAKVADLKKELERLRKLYKLPEDDSFLSKPKKKKKKK